jgi:hypothetical protein
MDSKANWQLNSWWRARGEHVAGDELTRSVQVAGLLQDTVCRAARSLSKNYGSAWMRQ